VWSKKSHDLILSGKILITYIFGKTNHVRKFVLKKIQDPDFGENNSQDKWLLPCPLSIINFSLNWCTVFFIIILKKNPIGDKKLEIFFTLIEVLLRFRIACHLLTEEEKNMCNRV
jgi:hypothetical protein